MKSSSSKIIPVWLVVLLLLAETSTAWAATNPEDISSLQSEIQNRKAQIETINNKLVEYKKKALEYSKQASSLQGEIAILENESAMTELDIAATQNAIEEENLHLEILETNIDSNDTKLAKEHDMLGQLLFEINQQDQRGGTFELIIGAHSFNEIFSAASALQSVNSDLRKTLVSTQQTRTLLQQAKGEREQRLGSLASLRVDLDSKISQLDAKISAKEVLSKQTRESELEYRVLMSELRQEQQGIAQTINSLQTDIEQRLADADSTGDLSTISWPVMGRITTTFHDPTYPFRYLFEHSGLDIAVPQGTPLEAAAPGYVAWAQTGRQYGNYVMIIHANGLATLYAHLSRIDVTVDQYVARGQIIGLTGGRPGSAGAGLSTGSHLHFEVRKGGIPTDPMQYLP